MIANVYGFLFEVMNILTMVNTWMHVSVNIFKKTLNCTP